MRLEGSCHCGAVRFRLNAASPYPYARCYCGICRKVQGGGGWATNLGGDAHSLEVDGGEHVTIYRPWVAEAGQEPRLFSERHFCAKCGSALWVFSPKWPDHIHPFASAIDTPLPPPPSVVHALLRFKASWVSVETYSPDDERAEGYPADDSLAAWHERHGLASPDP